MPSSPFASGRASPLPSFTPPRSSPSVGLLASLEPSLSGAVAEKMALSYRTSRGWFLPRYLRGQFTPLQLGLSGRRTLSVPVLKCLHPARDTRILRGAPSNGPASPRYSVCSIVRALGGTALALVVALMVLVALIRGIVPFRGSLPFQGDATTLVLTPDEVERVWLWEIASGRYPSKREVPIELGTKSSNLARGVIPGRRSRIDNPARPKDAQSDAKQVDGLENVEGIRSLAAAAGVKPSWAAMEATIVPVGPPRSYVSPQRSRAPGAGAQTVHGSDTSYPPRPFPNSVLDLDAVMDHCDFSHGEYVRDCLEVLRSNAGLDQGLRRGRDASWRTTFLPRLDPSTTDNRVGVTERATNSLERQSRDMTSLLNSTLFSSILSTRLQLTLASNPKAFTAHESHPTADKSCDPDHPRIFHIFWAGPFTDKPYSAALSFLYTQRLGLERPIGSQTDTAVCRPQLWIWINPGPASSLPDPQARQTMLRDLAKNPWSSPFLHRRFQDNIKFKLWNTTEQLDGVREMDGWRDMRLFNSGGVKYGTDTVSSLHYPQRSIAAADVAVQPPRPQGVKVGRDERVLSETAAAGVEVSDTANDNIVAGAEAEQARGLGPVDKLTSKGSTNDTLPPREKPKNELFDRVGSTSSSGYDRLSVVLSDMARFVLTHRFGGVYLDADTILLRDWEELWGWNGAFAYRWSRLEKYNTAVLKMGRGSAIGNLIFRSAVANGLDFHPMTVSRYTKDAQVEGLLLRLPDALFDPAWLNTCVGSTCFPASADSDASQ